MIEKGKQNIIVPVVGQNYLGKHSEKLTVTSVGDHVYGRMGWGVGYTVIGPKFAQHMMALQRFMDWAKDDPDARPRHEADKRPIAFNPFAEVRTQPCNRLGENGCSRTGWDIDNRFCCDNHYVVADRGDDPDPRKDILKTIIQLRDDGALVGKPFEPLLQLLVQYESLIAPRGR